MSATGRSGPTTEALAAYLEGEVSASEAVEIEAALADRLEARQRLEQLREIRRGLARPAPELEGIDLVRAVRRAAAAAPVSARPRFRAPYWASVLAAGALAAAVVLVARPRAVEFRAKGRAAGQDDVRWAGLQAYRVGRSGQPERLGDHLAAGDGLLFSYTNLGPRPFDFLMIFAVDARGEVRWFHPAYERLGVDPASISIRRAEAAVELGEVVRHDVPAGALTVHALFTRRPLHVVEVEAAIQRVGRDAPLSSAFDDCADLRLVTRVDP
jgi:hypothetical protein